MTKSFLFLGTGSSMGTPVPTCRCAVCHSAHPYNQRLRPSGLLKLGEKRFLFDAGPDFRQQALKFGIDRLDGIFITHAHFDHVAGLDDLRVYYFFHQKKLPCLLSKNSYDEIKVRFPYFFTLSDEGVMGASRFQFQLIQQESGEEVFEGEKIEVMTYEQGGMAVNGFRLGSFAYVMDLKVFTPKIYEHLKGVEVLVMSGLAYRPTRAHLTIDEAVEFSRQVGAKKTWFSHISHEVDHDEVSRKLPAGVQLAYDGLEITC
jgi:phosphoribosyl 1,2-cyclic phosphate phosphodiesterase